MLPFGVKYKSHQHAFSSDDDDDNNEETSLVSNLNNKSTNQIDQLLTKNKKRKEKEKEYEKEQIVKKKKQKIERESDTIKELKDRIEMFEEQDDDEEWEEEVIPNQEDEEPNMESGEKEDEYIQFTINNNDENEDENENEKKSKNEIKNEIIDLESEDSNNLIVHVLDDDEEQDVIIKNTINSNKLNELNKINNSNNKKEKEIEKLIIKNNSELILNNINYINNTFIEIDEKILKEIKNLILKEIPTSIQEFQTHPIYILDKFITKYDTIYPKDRDPISKIKTHSIYLREWIKPLHTRDRWLRDYFKKVNLNEKPYKIVKSSKFSKNSDLTELFGEWQTEEYHVPIISENDEIPKSEKGSYELWNSKFLPIGCSHISTNNEPLKGLTIVARKLKIDYARAMIGFEFKHKRSIPLYDGIIIHEKNETLLRSEYVKYQQNRLEKLIKKKNDRILNNWSKLVRGLLAREYVKHKYSNRKEQVHLHDVIQMEDDEKEPLDESDIDDEEEEDIEMNDSEMEDDEMSDDISSDDEKSKKKKNSSKKKSKKSKTTSKKKKNSTPPSKKTKKNSTPPSASSSTLSTNNNNNSTPPPTNTVQRMLASGKIVEFEQL